MINIQSVLLIVDGPSEVYSFREKFNKMYKCCPDLRIVNCNGKNVTPSGYANKSASIFLMALSARYKYIICILDKEKRRAEALDFSKEIGKAIIDKILSCSSYFRIELEKKIKVSVPDRMFENWILADIKGIKKKKSIIKQDSRQKVYEGENGARHLDSIMLVKYKKTTHAPILFKLISFDRAKNNSKSFCHFTKCFYSCN